MHARLQISNVSLKRLIFYVTHVIAFLDLMTNYKIILVGQNQIDCSYRFTYCLIIIMVLFRESHRNVYNNLHRLIHIFIRITNWV